MQVSEKRYKKLVKQAFDHIMEVMFDNNKAKDSIIIIPKLPDTEKREIAILIQFTDGLEGKLILSCSKKTATKITNKLAGRKEETKINPENEKQAFKDSLGELMNILSGNIAYALQRDFGTIRITTPTIVTGNDLIITIYDISSMFTYLESQFGIIELTLTLNQ